MPGNPFTDPNWAPDLADTVERVVGKVRTVATDNAIKASRGVVYGVLVLIAMMVAVPLVVLLLLGLFQQLIDTWTAHSRAVWISYLSLGALLMIGGFLTLRMRHGKDDA